MSFRERYSRLNVRRALYYPDVIFVMYMSSAEGPDHSPHASMTHARPCKNEKDVKMTSCR